jgi:hypothetical protein
MLRDRAAPVSGRTWCRRTCVAKRSSTTDRLQSVLLFDWSPIAHSSSSSSWWRAGRQLCPATGGRPWCVTWPSRRTPASARSTCARRRSGSDCRRQVPGGSSARASWSRARLASDAWCRPRRSTRSCARPSTLPDARRGVDCCARNIRGPTRAYGFESRPRHRVAGRPPSLRCFSQPARDRPGPGLALPRLAAAASLARLDSPNWTLPSTSHLGCGTEPCRWVPSAPPARDLDLDGLRRYGAWQSPSPAPSRIE